VNERLANWLPRSGLCELLAALFLLRGLVPMGYMPALDATGTLTLRLCSVASLLSARPAPAAPDGNSDRHAPDNGDHGICPHVCGTVRQRESRTPEA
jgi:hypothetical protein